MLGPSLRGVCNSQPLALLVHVGPDDRDHAIISVLIAQPLEDSFRSMLLFGGRPLSSSRIRSMIPTNGSSLGRAGGRTDILGLSLFGQ
jgi:hypothetical protein